MARLIKQYKGKSSGAEGSADDDEPDEESAGDGDSDASVEEFAAEEEEFAAVKFGTNTGSVQFALDCFNAVSGLRKSFSEFRNDVWPLTDNVTHDAGNHEATVRRRPTDQLRLYLRTFKCLVNPAYISL